MVPIIAAFDGAYNFNISDLRGQFKCIVMRKSITGCSQTLIIYLSICQSHQPVYVTHLVLAIVSSREWIASALAIVSALVCISNAKTAALFLAMQLRSRTRRRSGQTIGANRSAAIVCTADLFCLLLNVLNALFVALHLCMYCTVCVLRNTFAEMCFFKNLNPYKLHTRVTYEYSIAGFDNLLVMALCS